MLVNQNSQENTGEITELPTFCFEERIKAVNPSLARLETLRTLQLNMGNRCNLACTHCHIEASPEGSKIMGKEVIDGAVAFLRNHNDVSLDITGGCPELNPHFSYLITQTDTLGIRRTVRTNLTIATERGMTGLPEFYRDHGLELTASLPCVTAENVDRQRGKGVFERSITALRRLNDLGYGNALDLTLVYNPGDDALPGSKKDLEELYRRELSEGCGIRFTNFLALTNAPIGRFKHQLAAGGNLAKYLRTLAAHFNSATLPSLMCRFLISVDWTGNLFNCDFNQALQLNLPDGANGVLRIHNLEEALQRGIPIRFDNHCFACAAGEGSSCLGQSGGQKGIRSTPSAALNIDR